MFTTPEVTQNGQMFTTPEVTQNDQMFTTPEVTLFNYTTVVLVSVVKSWETFRVLRRDTQFIYHSVFLKDCEIASTECTSGF